MNFRNKAVTSWNRYKEREEEEKPEREHAIVCVWEKDAFVFKKRERVIKTQSRKAIIKIQHKQQFTELHQQQRRKVKHTPEPKEKEMNVAQKEPKEKIKIKFLAFTVVATKAMYIGILNKSNWKIPHHQKSKCLFPSPYTRLLSDSVSLFCHLLTTVWHYFRTFDVLSLFFMVILLKCLRHSNDGNNNKKQTNKQKLSHY